MSQMRHSHKQPARCVIRHCLALAGSCTLVLGLALPAQADAASELQNRYTVYADVVNVEPSYRRVSVQEPQRECWVEQQEHVVRYEGQPRRYQQAVPQRRETTRSSTADVVAGGVIGGVIGNQLGRKGSSGRRTGATVAGAILGSVLANEVSARHQRNQAASRERHESRHYSRPVQQPVYETRPVERCRETMATRYEQRIDGYEVTYRYDGQTFRTYSRRDPGSRIELQVSLKPARQ